MGTSSRRQVITSLPFIRLPLNSRFCVRWGRRGCWVRRVAVQAGPWPGGRLRPVSIPRPPSASRPACCWRPRLHVLGLVYLPISSHPAPCPPLTNNQTSPGTPRLGGSLLQEAARGGPAGAPCRRARVPVRASASE